MLPRPKPWRRVHVVHSGRGGRRYAPNGAPAGQRPRTISRSLAKDRALPPLSRGRGPVGPPCFLLMQEYSLRGLAFPARPLARRVPARVWVRLWRACADARRALSSRPPAAPRARAADVPGLRRARHGPRPPLLAVRRHGPRAEPAAAEAHATLSGAGCARVLVIGRGHVSRLPKTRDAATSTYLCRRCRQGAR
jgi:hypothetical protein